MNLNKAFVLGNITRDPEMRAMPSGQQVASFGIATNRFYTDASGQKKQDTEFHNIVCFGKLADIASRFITKGSLVLIEGRIKNSSWQGTDGVKKYKSEIIAETLQLGPRFTTGAGGTGGSGQYSRPSGQRENQPQQENIPVIEENSMPTTNFVSTEEPNKNDEEIDIRDIPF